LHSLAALGIKVQDLVDYYSNPQHEKTKHIEIQDRMLTKYAPISVIRWLGEDQKDEVRKRL
jgi:hypothetical protein